MNRYIAPVAAITLAAFATACSEEAAPTYDTAVTVSAIEEFHPTVISRGVTAYVNVVSPNRVQKLIDGIKLVNHVYPNGPMDDKAPLIGDTPSRVNVQVTLSGGEDNYLENDAACETIRIDGSPERVGALAIGGDGDGVLISWPHQDKSTEFVYLCSFQGMEPASDLGVILYTQ